MPSVHRIAQKKLLESAVERIARIEACLINTNGDYERSKFVEEIADLHVRKKELIDALSGEVD